MMTLNQYLDAEQITQAKFAKRIKVTQGTVSKLCAGRRPGWDLAARIAAATAGKVPVEAWLAPRASEAAE